MPAEPLIFASPALLAAAAADHIVAHGRDAIARRGRFLLALAGGRTPVETYRRLAEPDAQAVLDWSCVHVYFTDERAVPPGHPDSNFGMACDALLNHVPILPEHLCRIPAELGPEAAARRYDLLLGWLDPAAAFPAFDLVLLGLGEDGHVASLFPASPALAESACRAVATRHPDGSARISMTLPLLQAARARLLLVSGAGKAGIVARLQHGDDLPAARLQPLQLLLDRDAARLL